MGQTLSSSRSRSTCQALVRGSSTRDDDALPPSLAFRMMMTITRPGVVTPFGRVQAALGRACQACLRELPLSWREQQMTEEEKEAKEEQLPSPTRVLDRAMAQVAVAITRNVDTTGSCR